MVQAHAADGRACAVQMLPALWRTRQIRADNRRRGWAASSARIGELAPEKIFPGGQSAQLAGAPKFFFKRDDGPDTSRRSYKSADCPGLATPGVPRMQQVGPGRCPRPATAADRPHRVPVPPQLPSRDTTCPSSATPPSPVPVMPQWVSRIGHAPKGCVGSVPALFPWRKRVRLVGPDRLPEKGASGRSAPPLPASGPTPARRFSGPGDRPDEPFDIWLISTERVQPMR